MTKMMQTEIRIAVIQSLALAASETTQKNGGRPIEAFTCLLAAAAYVAFATAKDTERVRHDLTAALPHAIDAAAALVGLAELQ